MKKPVLVIMAAGMGSRYGGLKQIDTIDEQGNLIIDYSIYDSINAGFEKVIFIIKQEMETAFKERIGNRISRIIETAYVYQEISRYAEDTVIPPDRQKPWGTAHAVLCCMDVIDSPFVVINADDYYGPDAFAAIYNYLLDSKNSVNQHGMVGYSLEQTLTENGYVSRGVCQIDKDGWLKGIKEYEKISRNHTFPSETIVSMNMWGFKESILPEIEKGFHSFLSKTVPENPLTSEFYLPFMVQELLQSRQISVKVLKSSSRWYGVTYKEDKPAIVTAIQALKDNGIYPQILWEEIDENK